MPGLQQLCTCRGSEYVHRKRRAKECCKRKRQFFVYNPEEEIWHEPYMQSLHREFSDESMHCGSKIELPWSDIALPSMGMKIRSHMTSVADRKTVGPKRTKTPVRGERRESTGVMELPWQDMVITKIHRRKREEKPDTCDSSVEIPWADLALEKTLIHPPREEPTCATEDVEIPWDEILVPRNVVIKSERKQRHPSSDRPPRPVNADEECIPCGTPMCCAKIRGKIRTNQAKTNSNVLGPNWVLSSMSRA